MLPIKSLPPSVRSRLRSGVAMTDVVQCVEELVLNAADSGATNIHVRVDLGFLRIQVVDNGEGISESDMKLIGTRFATSKCASLEDLKSNLKFYGFRGEALASIIQFSGIVDINSRHINAQKTISKLFAYGEQKSTSICKVHRPSCGTTITIQDFMYNMPVRKKLIKCVVELEKIRCKLLEIALILPHISICLRDDRTCTEILNIKRTNSILQTFFQLLSGSREMPMTEVQHSKGWISTYGCFSTQPQLQKGFRFIYVNRRIVYQTKLHAFINGLFSRFYATRDKDSPKSIVNNKKSSTSPMKGIKYYPVYLIDISCPRSMYDVCLEPKKTLIEFSDWKKVFFCLEELFSKFEEKENENHSSFSIKDKSPSNLDNYPLLGNGVDCKVPTSLLSMFSFGNKGIMKENFHSIEKINSSIQSSDEKDPKMFFTDRTKKSKCLSKKAGQTPCMSHLSRNDKDSGGNNSHFSMPKTRGSSLSALKELGQSSRANRDSLEKTEVPNSFEIDGLSSLQELKMCNKKAKLNLFVTPQRRIQPLNFKRLRDLYDSFSSKFNESNDFDLSRKCQKYLRQVNTSELSTTRSKWFSENEVKLDTPGFKLFGGLSSDTPRGDDGNRNQEVLMEINNDDTRLGDMCNENREVFASQEAIGVKIFDGSVRDFHTNTGNNCSFLCDPLAGEKVSNSGSDEQRANSCSSFDLVLRSRENQVNPHYNTEDLGPLSHKSESSSSLKRKCDFDESFEREARKKSGRELREESMPVSNTEGSKADDKHLNEMNSRLDESKPFTNPARNSPEPLPLFHGDVNNWSIGDTKSPDAPPVFHGDANKWISSDTKSPEAPPVFHGDASKWISSDAKSPEAPPVFHGDVNKWSSSHAKSIPSGERGLSSDARELLQKWNSPQFAMDSNILSVEPQNSVRGTNDIMRHNVVQPYKFTKEMLKNLKVLGQVDKKFIAASMPLIGSKDPLIVIIDQHAADERVRLERFLGSTLDANVKADEVSCLMEIAFDDSDVRIMKAFREYFNKFGLQFTEVSANSVVFHGLPISLVAQGSNGKSTKQCEVHQKKLAIVKALVVDICKNVLSGGCTPGNTDHLPPLPLPLLHGIKNLACFSAIKFGDELTIAQCEELVKKLSGCRLPFQCAHGRPSIVPLVDLNSIAFKKKVTKLNLRKLSANL